MPADLLSPTVFNIGNFPPRLQEYLVGLFGATWQVLRIPFTFATADNAVLWTVPSGYSRVNIGRAWYDVTTAFTGGAASAIGASSSNTAYNTAGDIVGGATGDVAAGLTVRPDRGTVGAKLSSSGVVVLLAGDTIKHNRITSAFTAGVANLYVPVLAMPDT